MTTSPFLRRLAGVACVVVAVLALRGTLRSETAIAYRFTFPEPQHHWMAVEASFTELAAGPLELRMSRSSPGRYSLHDFAKNVYDVEAAGPDGRRLPLERPDAYGWTIAQHGPSVTVRYKVFGDRIDGTYLAVDPTHAHINMPAAIMWARGLDDRPVQLTFVPPAGAKWDVASQLYPTSRPMEFTAPNLQYLMDSPTELGPVAVRQFELDGHRFRYALHHTGTNAELDGFVADVQKIVQVERDVFREFPSYEPGYYTFIADYLPYASGDGMEHRNSTVMTSSSAIRTNRAGLLGTVAHEFFHNWNVERIRPKSLEPFDLERANTSGELWLAEGFTQYYQPLALSRAGVAELGATIDDFADLITTVQLGAGRSVRSAEEMSRMAPFTDGGRTIDRTNWSNTYISYYPFGGAIALALDLSLRERYEGRVTLDDFMRAMWRVHGRGPAPRPGYVAHPYTIVDAEQRLAEVSGDPAFANDFFARYIHGREVADYAALLAPAGLVLQKRNPGRAWWGDVRLEGRSGVHVAAAPPSTSPAYKAGLDVDDEIRTFDGAKVNYADDILASLRRRRPGDVVSVEWTDRTGAARSARVLLEEDPRLELVTVESTGGTLTPAQRAFRSAWLGRKG
jgi:predicted metalloprotease with PDZ domain